MKRILLIALLMCAVCSCEEPNYKPATDNVNEYILKDEFKIFISETFNQFKNFDTQKDLDRYLQENASKYQHLNTYQDEVHFIKLRFDDYLRMKGD